MSSNILMAGVNSISAKRFDRHGRADLRFLIGTEFSPAPLTGAPEIFFRHSLASMDGSPLSLTAPVAGIDNRMAARCSAALGYFLKRCDPCPRFPEPWNWVVPSRDCRRTVSDPTSVLKALQGGFEDDILLAAELVVRRPNSKLSLHLRLCALDGLLIAVRDRFKRRVIDVLAPRGLISGQAQSVNVPILPPAGESAFDTNTVTATSDAREAALLRTLGIPVVLMRGIRSLKFAELDEFWTPKWTAVAGCLPMISGDDATPDGAADSPTPVYPIEPESATNASSSNLRLQPASSSAGTATSPADAGADTIQVHDNDVAAAVAPFEHSDIETAADRNTIDATDEGYFNDFLDDRGPGRFRDLELMFVGCSLLELSVAARPHLRTSIEYLREANNNLGLGRKLPAVWSPTADDLGCLRFALGLREIQPVWEWFENTLSTGWTSVENFCSPPELRQATLTFDEARNNLLTLLMDPLRCHLAPSQDGTGDSARFQAAHEDYAAMVERYCVGSLLSALDRERDPVAAEILRQLSAISRNIWLIEPYTTAQVAPDQLLLRMNLGDRTPGQFLAEQQEKFIKLAKTYDSMKRRHR